MALPGKWFYRTGDENGVILQIELGAGYAMVVNLKPENGSYVHVTCWDCEGEATLGVEWDPAAFRQWLDEAVMAQDEAVLPLERVKHRNPRL